MVCKRCLKPGRFRPQRRTCMDCEATLQAARRAADPEEAKRISRESQRRQRERDPDQVRARTNRAVAAYRERHRERLAAERRERERSPQYQSRYGGLNTIRALVFQATRDGRLTKPDRCDQCHKIGTVEAAHEDYSQPLQVRWLCRSCHRRWDHAAPKTR